MKFQKVLFAVATTAVVSHGYAQSDTSWRELPPDQFLNYYDTQRAVGFEESEVTRLQSHVSSLIGRGGLSDHDALRLICSVESILTHIGGCAPMTA